MKYLFVNLGEGTLKKDHNTHLKLNTIHLSQHTTLDATQYTLHTTYYILNIAQYTLHTTHYILLTIY